MAQSRWVELLNKRYEQEHMDLHHSFLVYMKCSFFRNIRGGLRAVGLMALICIGLAAPSPAKGYTLQGPQILELMIHKLSQAKTLRVVQQVTIDDPSVADHQLELKETLSYSFPNRFRSDAVFENTSRIHVDVADQSLTIIDGHQTSGPENPYDRYKDLLLIRSRNLLHEKLLSYGVDVEKTSVGRFNGRIVYVIGAQYPDESVSQLMVDKESFLPLRWINILSTDPEDRLEFVYSKWQKKDDVWYPMQIESYHNHHLIRRMHATGIKVNAAFSPDLFDIARLKSAYPPAETANPPKPALSPAPGRVPQTMEDFPKKVQP
jgi:outer membrane lipoprotein-sorting protein